MNERSRSQGRHGILRTYVAVSAIVTCTLASGFASAVTTTVDFMRCEMHVAGAPGRVTLKLTNLGSQTFALLRRNTPFEPMQSEHLQLTRNGKPVAYSGRLVKRSPPGKDEYLVFAPGSSQETVFALADGYDVSRPGRYRLYWPGELIDAAIGDVAVNPDDPRPHRVTCKTVHFTK